METKQLILEKHCGKVSVIYRINAYAAMQEYAEYYHTSQTEMPSDDIELISLRKQLDEATKYIKALEEREF